MEHRWSKLLLFIALCAFFSACSSQVPVTKKTATPPSVPKITEEDVADDNSAQPKPSAQPEQPAFSGAPAPPVEEPAPTVETGPRQPRRIEFRDMRGRGKNWSPGGGGSEQEP
jgi:type IV secretory pathway VirB10-like protein